MIVNDFFRSLLKCLIEINYKWKKLKNFLQTKTACDSKLYLLNICMHVYMPHMPHMYIHLWIIKVELNATKMHHLQHTVNSFWIFLIFKPILQASDSLDELYMHVR